MRISLFNFVVSASTDNSHIEYILQQPSGFPGRFFYAHIPNLKAFRDEQRMGLLKGILRATSGVGLSPS